MASIFTYQEEPPRVHSPWSTPGNSSPRPGSVTPIQNAPEGNYITSMTKLEPERQDGPTEYKLHLLLRSRQKGSTTGTHLTPTSSQPAKVSSSESLARSLGEAAVSATPYHTSQQSRQARLQQLTTQLLWRLQQSSPFHSSSNANLILPMLPEATPRLGVPDHPARLLPGLEESQGALYEIGVADDGTLVGLVSDELEESLNNLRAMAASLGCVVDILKRVLVAHPGVGSNDRATIVEPPQLWVAEVLVRPDGGRSRTPPLEEPVATMTTPSFVDNKASRVAASGVGVQQIRIAIVGASSAGKSSLLGTLTTSVLDNGRGKSRLSLLKHRHEITSGITSSVAQELIGYDRDNSQQARVVNYASGDVSSWPDIHNLSTRLVFLSDSPGLPRYAKSAFRTLVSWDPQWTMFCISADAENGNGVVNNNTSTSIPNQHSSQGDDSDADMSIAHLRICIQLNLRIVVVVTKMDIATRTGLKATLSKVLSLLKDAGRKPVLLSATSNTIDNPDESIDVAAQLLQTTGIEREQLDAVLKSIAREESIQYSHVPIVLTSSVNGTGFGKLHELLKEILDTVPPQTTESSFVSSERSSAALFRVDETFAIPPSRVYQAGEIDHSADQGIVLCGYVASGCLAIGDHLRLGPFWLDTETNTGNDMRNSPRAGSYANEVSRRPTLQSLPADFSKSLQGERITIAGAASESTFGYVDVSIVSLRSLRLPVRSMGKGETGTVGIQPVDRNSLIPLSRARKGMILSSAGTEDLSAYRSFTADFPANDFAVSNSPPLILGGHAIVYVNSTRAAVKVTAVHLGETDVSESSSPVELFSFDGEAGENSDQSDKIVRITFKFVSSIEWLQPGDTALIVPNMTAAGPVSGPPAVTVTGLSGFVGQVVEVFS